MDSKVVTRTMYQVRIGKGFGRFVTLGRRYVSRKRAHRIAKWLGRRGVDAHISAGLVNMPRGSAA